jgi:predicted molibdopterin-dependent oxidoreductase YjgC
MFARLPDTTGARVAISIDGETVDARAGDTVAAALLAAGRLACRSTPVTGAPRGPFCMMGVCFDCLVEIDGRPNQQGCATRVAAGMRIVTQRGARAIATPDVELP